MKIKFVHINHIILVCLCVVCVYEGVISFFITMAILVYFYPLLAQIVDAPLVLLCPDLLFTSDYSIKSIDFVSKHCV